MHPTASVRGSQLTAPSRGAQDRSLHPLRGSPGARPRAERRRRREAGAAGKFLSPAADTPRALLPEGPVRTRR